MRCTELPVRHVIYLPSRRKDGVIWNTILLEIKKDTTVSALFALGVTGLTVSPAHQGHWKNAKGERVSEEITKVEFFTKDDPEEGVGLGPKLVTLYKELLTIYDQESLAAECDNSLFIWENA